jgi:hypothetical protein
MLALPLIAASCAQPIVPGPALSELPVLPQTTACDGQFNEGAPFICRQMSIDRQEAVFEYEAILVENGWRLSEDQTRESSFPSSMHGKPTALWFERPIDAECSELLSVHLTPIETPEEGAILGMFFFDGYDPACADARKPS